MFKGLGLLESRVVARGRGVGLLGFSGSRYETRQLKLIVQRLGALRWLSGNPELMVCRVA